MGNFLKSTILILSISLVIGGCAPAMIDAVNSKNTEIVAKALESGALVNAHYENGFTPLLKAATNNDFKMVQYLVEKGADVNIVGSIQGSSALHWAVQNGNIEMIKYLVEKKANVNAVNFTSKETPLLWAAKAGNLEVVKYLVENKADIKIEDIYKQSALYLASLGGKTGIVKYLVENGANINKKGFGGHTPLSAATSNSHLETAKYLIEKGADVNAKQIEGWTPLHFAAYYGRLEVVEFLIDAGADMDLKNSANQTSLDIASPVVKEYFQRNRVTILENRRKKEAQIAEEKRKAQLAKEEKEAQEAKAKKEAEIALQINDLIAKNDFEGLKLLTEQNPYYVNYIQDAELRLMLTGPKGMKVGDIRKLLKDGKSEMIVVSLIKRVQIPYKEFSLEEIEELIKMELTDKTISAMIDVTTELLKDERKRKEQEFYQAENKRLMEQKAQPQTIIKEVQTVQEVQTTNQNNNSGSQLADKATEILLQEGTKMLLKSLFR